ncbi:MAG: hypothetical protein ABIH26_08350 [Candidatus Eisenbacteria bacterium]
MDLVARRAGHRDARALAREAGFRSIMDFFTKPGMCDRYLDIKAKVQRQGR